MIKINYKKLFIGIGLGVFFIIFTTCLLTLYLYNTAPVDVLYTHYPVPRVLSSKGEFEMSLRQNKPKEWVSIKDISPIAAGAIVVSEDWAFYEHNGVDFYQLRKAIWQTLTEGRDLRGASGISQQTIKNIFLDNERSLWRKFIELLYTLKLEVGFPKEKILEFYLNIVEFDKGIFGIQKASLHYFGKYPRELNAREGAFLAMVLPSPRRYSVSFKEGKLTDYARETIGKILVKLRQAKYYKEEDRLKALETKFIWED
jgi:monofunctional biosynthetic peptidoglycan transglycosylase